MRAGIVLAALAATTFAVPQPRKRDLVVVYQTETDIVYVTALVTVTADPVIVIATPPPAAPTSTSTTAEHRTRPRHKDVKPFPLPGQTTQVLSSPTFTTRPAAPSTTSIALPPVLPLTSIALPPVLPITSIRLPDPVSFPPVVTSTTLPVVVPVPVTTSTTKAAPTTSTTTTSTTAATVAAPKPSTYQQLVVAHHNLHRRNHSAPDIAWDNGLASAAAKIAASCKYAHNTDVDRSTIGGYGQNIAAGVGADNISLIITELFYNGEVNYYNNLYGQASPDMSQFEHWGHFSQIVWRDTLKVGCATQHCDSLANVGSNVPPHFTVCNYQSPGNVGGEYDLVGNSLRLPTAHWNYYL